MSLPTMIGRYRVLRRLGAGAFATVWLAEDDVLDSLVAIKVLADNWAHHPDVRARFEQEAQVLRRADSERLVRVHDFGELPDGRPYQVMTYAAGGTLADRLESGPLPIGTTVRIATDIAEAVTVLHQSGVLHRDLKPSNVLFDTVRGVERVLVADLGLAKSIAQASGFTVAAGTPGYMAPEQRLPGGGLDERADVHAIGAMTYQMLTGRTPALRAPITPSKLRPGIPRQLDRVVMRAIDADRSRRFPTAAAFAAALDVPPKTRRIRHASWVVLPLAALTTTAGATVPGGTPPGWVRVADRTGTISVSVPEQWALQLRDSGWETPAGERPGLRVSADLADSDAPGVFAGLFTESAGPTPPSHGNCTRLPERRVVAAGRTGVAQRWTGCEAAYTEVLLDGVYLQITQVDGTDRTDDVLRTLRLDHS
ncbi:serine/threonine-protein kinase [Actinoplanes sp. NPDC023714]|uniref:serine/threonine-protein kinase n=1 Tax=Actinoplanes sp. NPDC023714 TaxID=3154322 RepID=UPI003409ECAC